MEYVLKTRSLSSLKKYANRIFLICFLSLGTSALVQGQTTTWTGGAGPGDFTNSANWNNGAPLDQDAIVDTSSGAISITLASPTPDPYSINSLTVDGDNALTFDQSSGTLSLASGALDFGTSGSVYNLSGGTLQVGGASGITGSGTLNLGGGTLQAVNSALSLDASVDVTLTNGVFSTIDTNGLEVTINGSVNGASSGLVKTGLGDLELNNASNTMGSLQIQGGSVTENAGTVITTTELAVGAGAGNTGSYNMTGGSLVFPSGTPPALVGGTASSFRIGDFGGTGTFTQTGGSVTVEGGMDIGNQGGNGTYDISGGTLDLTGGGLFALGRTTSTDTTASTGLMDISGTAQVTVASGNFIIGNRDTSSTLGTGTVTQTGGTFTIDSGANLYLSAMSNGNIYNLNGGMLQIGGDSLQANYTGTGTYQFNLGGGDIQVTGSALTTDVTATLTADTYSIIDTNGLGATWNGAIDGATGGLVKIGAGDLNLTNASNAIGSFLIDGGNVNQSAGTLTASELAVGTGTSTGVAGGPGNIGSYTMTGGSLIFPGGTTPAIAGSGSASSFRVGDYGGTGTFTQDAGTVVTLGAVGEAASLTIGNQGGTGTYYLNGGSLTLADGYIDLGRSTSSSWGVSSGTLDMTGGILEIESGAYLALGGNIDSVGVTEGAGVLTQTGGTILIDAGGAFDLSAYGTGTYNLDGGTLEVGGTDLQARFAAGAPTTNFNLGGGTIQVIGSDLSVSANATLVNGTTSTLNTGSFNATWSGSLTGSGNLAVTGTGTVTLDNIDSTGLLDLQNGTLVSAGISNSVGQLNVDEGNTVYLQVGTGNSLTVTGTGEQLPVTPVNASTAGLIYGNSTLNLSGNGTVNLDGTLGVGVASGSTQSSGTLNIAGSTQVNFNFGGLSDMYVGAGNGGAVGTVGTVNQENTSVVRLGSNMTIGADNATGVYNLSGSAVLTSGGSTPAFVYIGFNQLSTDTSGTTSGTLNITGSNTFTLGLASELRIGAADNRSGDGDSAQYGGTGEIVQSGSGSVVTFNEGNGGGGAGVWLGDVLTNTPGSISGATGTYELEAGTLDIESGAFSVGESEGASGYLNQTGGTLTTGDTSNVLIGDSGTGYYNMSGGTATFQNGLSVGNNAGSQGIVNQTGGAVSFTGGSLNLNQTTSVYNLYGGTLAVGGSGVTGAGQLNVSSGSLNTGTGTATGTGGTLTGNGSVNATTVVSNNGMIAPGSTAASVHTPGALTFSNLSLNSGSILAWNLANESTADAGTNFDVIKAATNGAIQLSGTLTLNLSFGSSINFSDSFWTSAESWTLVDATASGASLTDDATINITSSSSPSYASDGAFSTSNEGNEVVLNWTPTPQAAPEPSTYFLLILGGIVFVLITNRQPSVKHTKYRMGKVGKRHRDPASPSGDRPGSQLRRKEQRP